MMDTPQFTDSEMARCRAYVAKFGAALDILLPDISPAGLADLLAAAAERDEPLTQETAEALADELGIAYDKDAPE